MLPQLLMSSLALLVRWGVSLWPHSGQHQHPMYGDYEAQRHWQEITLNLPLKDWYHNTSDNDLQYWGLDYPPLTAYHSWVVGVAAGRVNTSWVELRASRGTETPEHRLMMRLSVMVADLLILLPAIFMFSASPLTLVTILAYPGLIIIDHGHFQYNNISLGLALMAVAQVTRGRHILGSVLFVLALNYKQMELYHALPFFCYLLGVCWQQRTVGGKLLKLVTIGVAVILSFAMIWAPFIALGPESVTQVLKRVFPFDRGLFEDKVANFWCALDVVVKLKQKMDIPDLTKLCLATTLLAVLPTNLHLLCNPGTRNFVLSLVNTSLGFFLFSFHVHEKSILLAALPICLLTFSETPDSLVVRTIVPWLLTITTFSMLPLLIKDGLLLPTLSLSVLYLTLVTNLDSLQTIGEERPRSVSSRITMSPAPLPPVTMTQTITKRISAVSILGCVILTLLTMTVPAPETLPFLWPLLICVYSAAHFMAAFVFFNFLQFSSSEEKLGMKATRKKKTN